MKEQPGSSESDDALLLELPAGCFAHIISYLACLSDTAALSLACRNTSQQMQVSSCYFVLFQHSRAAHWLQND